MTIVSNIQSDLLQARKQRSDQVERSLLTTLMGDIQNISIDNQHGPVTDKQALALVNKYIKNLEDTVDKYQDGVASATQQRELDILNRYTPKQLSDDQLRDIITKIVTENELSGGKAIGVVMGQLSSQYPSQYKGDVASKLAKEILLPR